MAKWYGMLILTFKRMIKQTKSLNYYRNKYKKYWKN